MSWDVFVGVIRVWRVIKVGRVKKKDIMLWVSLKGVLMVEEKKGLKLSRVMI